MAKIDRKIGINMSDTAHVCRGDALASNSREGEGDEKEGRKGGEELASRV